MIENEDVVKQLLRDANIDSFEGEMEKEEFINSILYRWMIFCFLKTSNGCPEGFHPSTCLFLSSFRRFLSRYSQIELIIW